MKLKTFEHLVHVGTLCPQDKGVRGASHEGAGLSVSEHPQAWVRIARLGGLPWWTLQRENNRFLDVHALSDAQRNALSQWALEQGLLCHVQAWQVSWFDDELGQEVYSIFETRAQAQIEAPDADDASDTEGTSPRIEAVLQWQGTAELAQRARRPHAKPFFEHAWDLAAVEYADFVGLDGVFWNDELAPECYSAPRAVIVPRQVCQWRKAPLSGAPGLHKRPRQEACNYD